MTEAIQEFFKTIFGNNVVLATIIISMLPIIELRGGIPFGMSKTFWGQHALSSWQSLWFSFLGSSLVVPILALLLMPILNWLKKTKAFKKLATKFENSIKAKSQKIGNQSNAHVDTMPTDMDNSIENAVENINTQAVVDTQNHVGDHLLANNIDDIKQMAESKTKNVDNQKSNQNTNKLLASDTKTTVGKTKNKIVYNKKFFAKLFGVMLFVAIPLPLTGVWTGTAIAVMLGIPFVWTCVSVILGNLIAGIIMQTICSIFPNFTTWILIAFLCLTLLLVLVGFVKNKIKKHKNKQKI